MRSVVARFALLLLPASIAPFAIVVAACPTVVDVAAAVDAGPLADR